MKIASLGMNRLLSFILNAGARCPPTTETIYLIPSGVIGSFTEVIR
jgi:hypothetical protein